MVLTIFIALLNGVFIALSRILNGQLSVYKGAFKASYVNHIVGFSFLTLMLLIFATPLQFTFDSSIVIYSGGMIGALYVAINNMVMTKLGSTRAIILVISGQMLFSLFLDGLSLYSDDFLIKIIGVALIVAGVVIKEVFKVSTVKKS